jgi:hypothetical protein
MPIGGNNVSRIRQKTSRPDVGRKGKRVNSLAPMRSPNTITPALFVSLSAKSPAMVSSVCAVRANGEIGDEPGQKATRVPKKNLHFDKK